MALRPLASRPAGRFRMPPLPGWAGGGVEPLRIGLLNNMPDAAFAATERQFRRILSAPGAPLADLQFFTLSGMKRACGFRAEVAAAYASHERLPEAGLDALIVTGCEPREGPLGREPWFRAFGEVVDWARTNTSSTLFSCLAAHAAVLHLDGIERRPLAAKAWGVFDCEVAGSHALLAGSPASVPVPHSRWNDLAEDDLAAAGRYRILRRSGAVGVDLFVSEERSLFAFLQGHPEYDRDTLAREHRRDMTRFLDGTREAGPPLPAGYLSGEAARGLGAFAAEAAAARDPALMERYPFATATPARYAAWHGAATRLATNWLRVVAARRSASRAAPRDAASVSRLTRAV